MEEKLVEYKCEICKEKATKICFECSSYLCNDWFEFIHKKGANSGHKKEEIDPSTFFDIRCNIQKFQWIYFVKMKKVKYIYI